MRTAVTVVLCFFLFISSVHVQSFEKEPSELPLPQPIFSASVRNSLGDAVVVADSDPFYSIISTSSACWYDTTTNVSGLLPLFVAHAGNLTDAQTRFLGSYFTPVNQTILVLGEPLTTAYPTRKILGPAPAVSLVLATELFVTAPAILILPYGTTEAYQLSLLAAPLASYLSMPILLFDENDEEIQAVCTQLQSTHAFLVGSVSVQLPNITTIALETEQEITDAVLSLISDKFGSLHYLTMANPSDVIPPAVINTTEMTVCDQVTNKKIILLNKEINLAGNDTRYYTIDVPEGTTRVQIFGQINQRQKSFSGRFFAVDPLIFMTFSDPQGNIVAYANSMGYDRGRTYLETLTCNASGPYRLRVEAYHGIKGGFFIQRGLSWVDATIRIDTAISTLETPHLPQIPQLSSLASYLTAAHGGLVIANASWELTDASYAVAAEGLGAGPWYSEDLHIFTNEKVNRTVQQLERTLETLDVHGLLSGYITGPAWLGILADTTMIPQYYYRPSQGGIPEKGLPSDNPYSLHQTLSVGRLIGWDVSDVSALVARTFFYETLCGTPDGQDDWHHRFSFVFGEGFGETGGLFHQVPYAKEIRSYNFSSKVYGILRNSRQFIETFEVFTGANYIEYLGHGDWFWLPASYYGLDMYSKAVDVAHVKDWAYVKPSVFLTSACLMGRIDGLPPQMSIGLAMLHAGCNGFVGATRETGQESGLTVLENHLIVDDWSIGEALRGEKQIDTEPPTFYVRVLYGDPAFNPYEPMNGFSSQGRPLFL